VTRIPGYADGDGVAKPVLVVGAGYDDDKYDKGRVDDDRDTGRGVFILDAATGAVVRSITPADGSATNLNVPGLEDSVPAKVSLLDSNGDELADRMYFTDTGANIWRVDIGSTLPTSPANESWQVVKFAELAADGAENDRRFFNAVDIVRIRDNVQALDVIMVGSGDRANPLGTDVNNAFYLLRDKQTAPYTTDAPDPDSAECDPGDDAFVADFRCVLPLGSDDSDDPGHLFDITSNVLNVGTEQQLAIAIPALNAAAGWKLELEGDGEKSLSDSITIGGKVAFTTFIPATVIEDANTCELQSGDGRLYIVDIYDGERDFVTLGPIIPDTPSVIVIDGEISVILPPGTPNGGDGDGDGDGDGLCPGGICNIGTFPAPFGNYWYREDY
jgi:type IV pilus assembly protein PilY1